LYRPTSDVSTHRSYAFSNIVDVSELVSEVFQILTKFRQMFNVK